MREAKAQGKTRYFTGVPCPYGHIAERIVSTRACAQCAAVRKKQWLAENPNKVNAQKRDWRARNLAHARALNLANQKKHRASANARSRRWYSNNAVQAAAATRDWAKRNPGRLAAKASHRRAAELKATPPWADAVAIERVYALAARFRALGCDFHVDHVVPLRGKTVCGLHVHTNLEIIEASANRAKSNGY